MMRVFEEEEGKREGKPKEQQGRQIPIPIWRERKSQKRKPEKHPSTTTTSPLPFQSIPTTGNHIEHNTMATRRTNATSVQSRLDQHHDDDGQHPEVKSNISPAVPTYVYLSMINRNHTSTNPSQFSS
jgi:hypothetical protein